MLLEFDGAWVTAPGGVVGRDGCRFLIVGTKPMMRAFDEIIQSLGYTYPKHQLLVRCDRDAGANLRGVG